MLKKIGKKNLIVFMISIIIFVVAFFTLQHLVMPKYMDNVLEGSFISEYYNETTSHDVIMIGDCEVYETFSPIVMWKDYGITSYIRGSAQQLIWQSYYLLQEMLDYEKPKVVVYNVQSMTHNEPQKEEYNRMTLDGMKMSKYKISSIKASMTKEEKILDYLFPILRYHNRIFELIDSDFKYYFNKRKVTHNGYYMRIDVLPYKEKWYEEKPDNLKFGDTAYKYLDKITNLCKENDIKLVLVKAPSISPKWYKKYDKQIIKYAKENNLLYINYLNLIDELGIDYNTDTYDGGLHMNLSGAEKLSKHLGKVLQSNYSLDDHRKDEDLKSIWQEKIDFYEDMKQKQQEELDKYGYLVNFGGETKR